MPRLVLPTYKVIRDTREQKHYGWVFDQQSSDQKPPRCDGTIVETLQTGDYSLVGYTDIFAIERKADFSELWGNYSKDKRPNFEAEMERMSQYKYAYILIESIITPDIMKLSPPQFAKGVPGKSLIQWLIGLTVKYNVNIIPVGACGHRMARMIFGEVVRAEKSKWVPMQPKKTQEDVLFEY